MFNLTHLRCSKKFKFRVQAWPSFLHSVLWQYLSWNLQHYIYKFSLVERCYPEIDFLLQDIYLCIFLFRRSRKEKILLRTTAAWRQFFEMIITYTHACSMFLTHPRYVFFLLVEMYHLKPWRGVQLYDSETSLCWSWCCC